MNRYATTLSSLPLAKAHLLYLTQLGREFPSGDKPFIWRMMHQAERKYQLFPKDKQQPAAPGKSLDPEQAFALAMGTLCLAV